jgi:hypothetical protein
MSIRAGLERVVPSLAGNRKESPQFLSETALCQRTGASATGLTFRITSASLELDVSSLTL